MQLGIVGLGRMGAFMAQRLIRSGHSIVGYVRHAERVKELQKEGSITEGASSLEDLVSKLSKPRAIDRKSTRLNSSHSQISYAVFCLHKKTRYSSLSRIRGKHCASHPEKGVMARGGWRGAASHVV